jgi:hypothetical protein
MPKRKRVTPWLRISITQGNVVQIAGLLGRSHWRGTPVGKGHAPYGGKQAFSVLLRARVLPLARRASPWHPLFRLRPPRHEPSSALPAGHALVLLASPLAERPRRPRLAQGSEACGSCVDVRRRHRRNRGSKLGDTGLLLAAGRAWGARLLRRGEPVERAAAQRIAAPRWGPAPRVAGALEVEVAC